MYKLYWRAGTAAFAVEALLEEMGEPYERIHIEQGKGSETPESFRSLNPLGQVPVLELPDGTVVTESAAIMIYLADIRPELGLAPAPDDPLRPVYLRWMVFLAAKLYQSYRHIYHTSDYCSDDAHLPDVRETGKQSLNADWQIIEQALETGPYFLGDRFSAVDLYFVMFPDWNMDRQDVIDRHPNIARLCNLVLERPAVSRVRADHAA